MEEEKRKQAFVRKRLLEEGLCDGANHWYTPSPDFVEHRRKIFEEQYDSVVHNREQREQGL